MKQTSSQFMAECLKDNHPPKPKESGDSYEDKLIKMMDQKMDQFMEKITPAPADTTQLDDVTIVEENSEELENKED